MSSGAQQRAAFRRLAEGLKQFTPASEMQQQIVTEAQRLTAASRAALCLLTEERDMLDFVAVAGEDADEILGMRIRAGDSLSGAVIQSGKPALWDRPAPHEGEKSPQSAAIVPVYHQGRILGTLFVQNKKSEDAFNEEDLDTLLSLTEYVSLAQAVDTTARTAREQARELKVLYGSAHTISASLNVQEVLENVLNSICAHLEHHKAALFLLNDDHTHLFIASERALSPEEREIQLSVDSRLVSQIVQNGSPFLLSDAEQYPEFEDISLHSHSLSAIYAPIRSREETHGLIMITSLQRHAYHEDDLKLLSAVAAQAGIAIENAWLYADAQHQAEEANALYDLSQHVNASLNAEKVLHFVANSVLNLLKVEKFALFLYDEEEGTLIPRITRNLDEAFLNNCPKIGEGIGGWVFEWQTPQAVSDVIADRRNASAPLHPFGVASTLCAPMHVGEEIIGVLHAMSEHRRLFTVAEMGLLYTIANQAAVAISNAIRYEVTKTRSQETRLYFRRLARAIGTALQAENLPQAFADIALELVRGDRCALYQLKGEELHLLATSHFRATTLPERTLALGTGIAGWAAKRGQTLLLPNLLADPRAQAYAWLARDPMSSALCTPLKLGKETVGVLEVYSQEPRNFVKEEAEILASFARRAGVAEKLSVEA